MLAVHRFNPLDRLLPLPGAAFDAHHDFVALGLGLDVNINFPTGSWTDVVF
jgi:hypothetical protein